MLWEHAITAFGVTAAFLLASGSIFVRLQRDRQHFILMRTALEKGLTTLPGATASWLISTRVGALTFTLGLGLAGLGVVLYATAQQLNELPAAVAGETPGNGAVSVPANDRPATADTQMSRSPGRGGPGATVAPPPRPPPPPANPAMERWRRMRNQYLVSLVAICAGGVLMLLGIVRVFFARIERQYAAGEHPPAAPPA